MTTANYNCITDDGYITAINADYSTALSGSGASFSAGNPLRTGQNKSSGKFYIFRSYLFFNTSNIPSGSTISGVDLKIYTSYYSGDDFQLDVVGHSTDQPPTAADWGNIGSTDCGHVNASDLTINDYTTISLNESGIALVVQAGITKIGLRSHYDISGTSPSGEGDSRQIMVQDAAQTGKQPILVVTYTAPEPTTFLTCRSKFW